MKKTITLCSAMLLMFGAFPIGSFAEEMTQTTDSTTPTEEVQPIPDGTEGSDTTVSSSTEESTDQSQQPTNPEESGTEESSTTDSTTEETTDSSTTNPTPVAPTPAPIPEGNQTAGNGAATALTQMPEPLQTESVTTMVIPEDMGSYTFEKATSTEKFIAEIGESAREIGLKSDLFASVMIAQAILESGSGSSQLSKAPHYNLFGIKGNYKGKSITFTTSEDNGLGSLYQIPAAFRSYPSYKESFEDYAALLKSGLDGNTAFYRNTWKSVAGTYQNATKALTGTYATDTAYSKKLNGLIETYSLTQYDRKKEKIVASTSDFPAYDNVNYDSKNSYKPGNCTQYVYNRITQLGGQIGLKMGNGQDWNDTAVSQGYQVSNTPKAGTAACFEAGLLEADKVFGHVAFVERVNEDGSIIISEMNAEGLGVVSFRTIAAEFTGMLSYITPK